MPSENQRGDLPAKTTQPIPWPAWRRSVLTLWTCCPQNEQRFRNGKLGTHTRNMAGGDLIWGENTSRELIGSEGGEIGWDLLLKGVEYKTPGFGPFFHVEDRELLRASEQRSGGTLASFCPLEHVRTSDWERGKTFRVPGKERARRDSSYLLSENNKYSFIIAFPFLQKNYITSFISFLI